MPTINLYITMDPKAQSLRLKLKLEFNLIPHNKERQLVVIPGCVKYLLLDILFELFVNLSDMRGSLYFLELRVCFLWHLAELNNMLSFLEYFLSLFSLFC